jgi:serine/threonine protein kinase
MSNSPTLSLAATNAGVIFGTAAYMSPEQAKGRPLDKRTDIFSFGCVLFEMLSGKPAFDGDDVHDILGSVLKSEPDWSRLPAETPPGIRKLLRLCLEKDLKRRRRDAGDVIIDIEHASRDRSEGNAATDPAPAPRVRVAWISAIVATAAAIVAIGVALRPLPEAAEMRLEIATPTTTHPDQFALSPDGNSIVFSAIDGSQELLWVRRFDTGESRALPGTDGGQHP